MLYVVLEKLISLDLSHNQFLEIPIEIGNLELLKELGEWEVSIGLLKNLKYLNLSYNLLKEYPDHVNMLDELKGFSISYNQLTKLPPNIMQFRYLERLAVDGNQLIALPSEIYRLKYLQVQQKQLTIDNIYCL